ncbi:hypothetical protein kuro4_26320 [Gelria sp. Kuro-4]|nr:hypothetical protein kuro4_26320 [Gelria sp. Kuro-4]
MKSVGLEERARKEKPHVKLYRGAGALSDELCREVELGLEEEGIPGELQVEAGEAGAAELAYAAAQASPLGTGVGLAADGLAVHYSRLPRERPLFFLPRSECSPAAARRLGANAARLVKGIPFKEQEDPPPAPAARTQPADGDGLRELVAAVVQRVLAEMSRAEGGERGAATSAGTH